jgi:hypothetical protein
VLSNPSCLMRELISSKNRPQSHQFQEATFERPEFMLV